MRRCLRPSLSRHSERQSQIATTVVGHDASHGDAEGFVKSDGRLRKATALSAVDRDEPEKATGKERRADKKALPEEAREEEAKTAGDEVKMVEKEREEKKGTTEGEASRSGERRRRRTRKRVTPKRLRARLTVAADTPASTAICCRYGAAGATPRSRAMAAAVRLSQQEARGAIAQPINTCRAEPVDPMATVSS